MLLGTFKTVFNSVFLVPTKTLGAAPQGKEERQSSPWQAGRERERGPFRSLSCSAMLAWASHIPACALLLSLRHIVSDKNTRTGQDQR